MTGNATKLTEHNQGYWDRIKKRARSWVERANEMESARSDRGGFLGLARDFRDVLDRVQCSLRPGE